MNGTDDITLASYIAAGFHALTTLVWATIASSIWRARGTARPQGTLLALFRIVAAIFALQYANAMLTDLLRFDGARSVFWGTACVVGQLTTVVMMPVLRHLMTRGVLGAPPPGGRWLALNYGSAPVALVATWLVETPGAVHVAGINAVHVYLALMTGLILWEAGRLARSGWRPLFMAYLSFPAFLAFASFLFVGVLVIIFTDHPTAELNVPWAISHILVGLAVAAPFAVRILGEVVRHFLVTTARLVTAAAIYLGVHSFTADLTNRHTAIVLDLAAVLGLVMILGPGGRWLRDAVDCRILSLSHRWSDRLRAFLRGLTPELGLAECCRQASAEVAEGLSLRGAGILLNDGTVFLHGQLELDRIAERWPTADQLPDRAFDLLWLDDVELQVELYEAGVTWVVPIRSPQQYWGHLFVAAGLLGTAAGDAKLEILESFAGQLAGILDSAALLVRAVDVERDLARAEKLAALGETAARLAHEIRNPVTAARSLAQMMAEEPTAPSNAEHAGLVVRELDRVERQVRSLLQFARQETYQIERMRLAEIVDATVHDMETCLGTDGVEIDLDLDPEVRVEADRERLRQVVVNLVSNAVDALGEAPAPRRLEVSVGASNGDAILAVRDNGTGVPAELLPRLFEPFVSQKAQGTGLGLAIAKRIVEAHRGRIEAEPAAQRGMVFRVFLPAT